MSIDLGTEHVVTLAEAAKLLPKLRGNRKPHISTLYRWISRGIGGVRLEAVKLGRTLLTSQEAIQRFCDRLTSSEPALCPARAASRARVDARIEEELDRHGF